MESALVIILVFVLITAVVGALIAFVVIPAVTDGRNEGEDLKELSLSSDVIKSINEANKSGYDYDMSQDEQLRALSEAEANDEIGLFGEILKNMNWTVSVSTPSEEEGVPMDQTAEADVIPEDVEESETEAEASSDDTSLVEDEDTADAADEGEAVENTESEESEGDGTPDSDGATAGTDEDTSAEGDDAAADPNGELEQVGDSSEVTESFMGWPSGSMWK
ncbi:hypothetical protein TetV_530 [Tetraselmis virus 1]|uniref:Uncharacterized protein n=1 Tax=Tetraselmis virus 1 TaxID=2060617 RepID=A0A2P0VNZ7_9VIRU|nr:hypothetical protein QJ968_gp524 [Tetraselmis virus 1]AUF82612.1 hypothetical protein TetV_530 [Tetraselmis virus 1]